MFSEIGGEIRETSGKAKRKKRPNLLPAKPLTTPEIKSLRAALGWDDAELKKLGEAVRATSREMEKEGL